ncbi:hypothetical protein EV702DRAFT_1051525 [Suillus placidus]|uniref:Uncharacterized protein n=1 Tax=Suillus placidus TaxID=48579 RepID=A0A9P7CUY8_9AGAM|nr:hypothetical protein EV702DRAFT_1051525 [Suillus placidus]
MSTRSASVHMEESVHIEKVSHEPLMFSISDLEWKFCVGDTVRVLDNTTVALQLKGKTGMVVQVDDDVVDVVDQSSDLEFTVAVDSLAMYIGDIRKQAPTITSINDDFPMKGDHIVVTEGFYGGKFRVVSKVNMLTRTLAFFSDSLNHHIWVPIRMTAFNPNPTAFNPNPTALRHTPEHGYDVVAGNIIQVVRGNLLRVSGTVLHVNLNDKTLMFKDMLRQEVTTSITYVARTHGRTDRDPMRHLLGKEVFIIHGPMKSYRGTLQSLSRDRCEVAVQGRKQEFMRAHVASWKGVLLTGVCLPLHQLREFLKLVGSSFVQLPHIAPPQTPRHSPHHSPPPDEPAPAVQGSVWDASIESLGLDRRPSPTKDNPWTFNETDREEHLLHPPDASASSAPSNPSSDWASYHNRIVDTVSLDHSSSREDWTKNKGMKVDPIPLRCLLLEPLVGKNKKFTLIRGDLLGSIHTTMTVRKDATDITTIEGKTFARADTLIYHTNWTLKGMPKHKEKIVWNMEVNPDAVTVHEILESEKSEWSMDVDEYIVTENIKLEGDSDECMDVDADAFTAVQAVVHSELFVGGKQMQETLQKYAKLSNFISTHTSQLLKAEQWRTAIEFDLPVTLVKLWGMKYDGDERRPKLAHSTMLLAMAIQWGTSHVTSPHHTQQYGKYMKAYLECIRDVFPGHSFRPNHHTCLHLHEFLLRYGPMHGWIIGGLQKTNTNQKIGELETTMLEMFCAAASVKAMLQEPGAPDVVNKAVEILQFRTDIGILHTVTQSIPYVSHNDANVVKAPVSDALRHILDKAVTHLNGNDYITEYKRLDIGGLQYSSWQDHDQVYFMLTATLAHRYGSTLKVVNWILLRDFGNPSSGDTNDDVHGLYNRLSIHTSKSPEYPMYNSAISPEQTKCTV